MKQLKITVVLSDDSDDVVKMALLSIKSKVDSLLRDIPTTRALLEDFHEGRHPSGQ